MKKYLLIIPTIILAIIMTFSANVNATSKNKLTEEEQKELDFERSNYLTKLDVVRIYIVTRI